MDAHERAEKLYREAEQLGKDAPSEEMIADAFSDMEFNHSQMISQLRAEVELLKEAINKRAVN